jgi:Transglycosylase SLT domain
MSERIAPLAADGVRAAIQRASQATGVDFSLLVETARRESALNPNARAGTSSATGLFQFIDSTWLDMVRRHGAEHGLGGYAAALSNGADAATRRDILALRNDPEISARMAGELTRENANALQARLGRAPTAGELYAAHVLGSGGAARLVEAAAQGAPNAAAAFPREASANRGLFYDHGQARSAQGLLDRLGLDATAAVGAPSSNAPTQSTVSHSDTGGEMSPALAQALFTLALMPLLQGANKDQDDTQQRDPLQALMAYARSNRS